MDAGINEAIVPPILAEKKPEPDELQRRVDAAREITNIFKLERYVYIACCGIAVALLFVCAIRLLQKSDTDYVGLGALFGSGGLITFSTGRLILMWSKILDYILAVKKEAIDNGN